ncbi:Protein of unknown function [Bacillus cereus]|uniref:Uncharacterized protein n=1 Tax=Bacillus wiedmannii TaxID=1890302 RepID=A0AB37YRD9_9BACI|nr:Protein of unknown function [Bacillus mobilis]SCC18424.1 Protein of unknown function [Bacillus cereus]SCC31063.1 Protein of unknown function [Bacillus wiedmannii]SCN43673.1 Protein of unknown function [Bacillus wiedmannii]
MAKITYMNNKPNTKVDGKGETV